jgi:hypothetical protein
LSPFLTTLLIPIFNSIITSLPGTFNLVLTSKGTSNLWSGSVRVQSQSSIYFISNDVNDVENNTDSMIRGETIIQVLFGTTLLILSSSDFK